MRARTLAEVFERELDYIVKRRSAETATPEENDRDRPEVRRNLIGLAMSGGGIRSATTMLGILQALSRMRILPLVDYFSTVSGGGYMATCLSALLSLNKEGLKRPGSDGQYRFKDRQQAAFSTDWERFPFNPDRQMPMPPAGPQNTFGKGQVAHLRTHGSFLVARHGLLSRDTLRSIGILLMGAFYHVVIVLVALFLLAAAYMGSAQWLAPHLDDRMRTPAADVVVTPASITFQQASPAVVRVHSTVAPQTVTGRLRQKSALMWHDARATAASAERRRPFVIAAVAGALLSVGAFAWVPFRRRYQGHPSVHIGESMEDAFENRILRELTVWFWAGAIAAVALVRVWFDGDSTAPMLLPFAAFAGAGFTNVVLLVLCATLTQATSGPSLWDRQSRSLTGSYKALVTYGAIFSLTLGLLPILIYAFAENGPWAAVTALLSAGLSRLLMLRTAGKEAPRVKLPEGLRHGLLAVAVWIFVVSLVVLFLGLLVQAHTPRLWYLGIAAAGVVGLAVLSKVDLNRMSLHYFYRDRLMETYLRTEIADPQQIMRPRTDAMAMPLKSLHGDWPSTAGHGSTAPYHLISCAVNLTSSRDLTRRNRKSGYFLFSKYFCGSDQTGYRPTADYRRGETQLSRAMTISGAAAAPAMGYRTFFAQAFVMVLFNARLGFWMENPHSRLSLRRHENHVFWPWWLACELLSWTSERSRLVNLSDGGHTGDNVGVYPLLARGCHVIIACDAECDPKLTFGSFTEALRQAYVDFGIDVDIDLSMLRPDPQTGLSRSHCAVGRIHYPDPALPLGWLVYLKSTLTGREPEPVRNYKTQSPAFPHESTVDQFFTDDQFESYRALGDYIAQQAFQG